MSSGAFLRRSCTKSRSRSACSAGSDRAGPAAATGSPPRASARAGCGGCPRSCRRHRARDPRADAARELEPVADPVAYLGDQFGALVVGDGRDGLRQLAVARAPVRPRGDASATSSCSSSSRRRARNGRRAARARRRRRAGRPGGSHARPAAGAISSTVPTTLRIGHAMSASVTSRSSITKPPSSIRLWAMNWRRKSAIAGPGHATQPSASRKRRCPSRGSSASRSCSRRMKSIRLRIDLTGSSSLKPVRLAHAGSAISAEDPVARRLRRPGRELLRDPERHREPSVDRAAERDQRAMPSFAPVGRGLVAEHPALRVTDRGGRPARSRPARDRPRRRRPARGR